MVPQLRVLLPLSLLLIAGCSNTDVPTGLDSSLDESLEFNAIVVPSVPIDLGTLGGSFSWAFDVNDEGHVVGYSQDGSGEVKAFLWTPATGMIDLGSLGGACGFQCRAHAINNFGQVTGQAVTAAGDVHAFRRTAGVMADLGTLGGVFSSGRDINETGEVAGSSDIDPTFPGLQRAFFVAPGGPMVELPTFGGVLGQGYGLNNAGVVVGEANFVNAALGADGFRWSQATGLVPLNLQAWGPTVVPARINDHGDIVGTIGAGPSRAFLLTAAGSFVDLHTLGGFAGFSQAQDVNQQGQVALSTVSGAVVWSTQDGFVGLPDLGFGLAGATAINSLGMIAGRAATASGEIHAVLWQTQPVSAQLNTVVVAIDALVTTGSINGGQATALVSKINNAAAQLSAGRTNAVRKILGAFISQVDDFIAGGTLSLVEGQALIAAAKAIQAQLP